MSEFHILDLTYKYAAANLKDALGKVKVLHERYQRIKLHYSGKRANLSLVWALELKGNLDVAEAIVAGALAREECRGSHSRTDFPKRDDSGWLKHTLAYFVPEGVRLEYKPVNIGPFEPKEIRDIFIWLKSMIPT